MPNALILPSLVILYLVSLALLWQGRRAISLGNWLRHRTFMLPAVFLAILSMALTLLYLLSTKEAIPHHLVMQVLLIVHLAAMSWLAMLIPVTLYRVARHLILPHKTMARWTIRVWALTCVTGILLNGKWALGAILS